jgi:hypothetical protein
MIIDALTASGDMSNMAADRETSLDGCQAHACLMNTTRGEVRDPTLHDSMVDGPPMEVALRRRLLKDVDVPQDARGWMKIGATSVTPVTSASLAPIYVSGLHLSDKTTASWVHSGGSDVS